MPDTEIRDLQSHTYIITRCPVFIEGNKGQPVVCSMRLDVTVETTIRGDDYGSFPVYWVGFPCGHSFEQMIESIKNAEFV
jgi:hypothetical protein